MLDKQKKLMMQLSLIFLLVLSLLAASSMTTFSPGRMAAEAAPSHITLTWTGDTATTQTITWKTEPQMEEGQVQYMTELPGKSWGKQYMAVDAEVETVNSNWGQFNIHTVTLTGLRPGTRYLYRVGSEDSLSEVYHFTTAAAKAYSYKFLVFGDSQSINYDTWHTTLHEAYQANPGAAFFINMGDLVDVGEEYGQWYAWFNAAHGVLENIPCMPIIGNHEVYAPGAKFARPALFTDQFKLPLNGPEGLQGQVYSFDYGDVHFIMLDTQIAEEGRFIPDMLEKEKMWLEEDLVNSKKKWKMVFMHRAPYNNKSEGNLGIRKAFAPILEKYHADVVFTAHDHVYAHTYPLYGGEAVNSPANGTVYVATGRSGSKIYSNSIEREWNNFFYNPLNEPNYLTAEIKGNLLTVKAFHQSGELIDEWSITK
ncbi:MAG: metallophosphoesterase family protein [Pelosinus sp.]|nr:metallophosphoesterase family protein [Pelosinus sp.]